MDSLTTADQWVINHTLNYPVQWIQCINILPFDMSIIPLKSYWTAHYPLRSWGIKSTINVVNTIDPQSAPSHHHHPPSPPPCAEPLLCPCCTLAKPLLHPCCALGASITVPLLRPCHTHCTYITVQCTINRLLRFMCWSKGNPEKVIYYGAVRADQWAINGQGHIKRLFNGQSTG